MDTSNFHHPDSVRGVAGVSSPIPRFTTAPANFTRDISISIGVIYLIASHTAWLDDDPILWFALMLMPTGPPAMKLTALADVNNAPDSEKLSIAKFLTIVYAISPLIAFTVVGSLKASEIAIEAS